MKIIFFTSNLEKLNEARLALAPFGLDVEGKHFPFNEPSEGKMEEIALVKLSQIDSIDPDTPFIVDDSGIFFQAYTDFPGILSGRVFRMIGYRGIDKLLQNEDRRAYFQGVIALKWKKDVKFFYGKTYGRIIEKMPKGVQSSYFPFDPIFMPDGADKVFAEMSKDEKLKYSYRRKALEELGKWIKERPSEEETNAQI
ncbi:hypothetical protein BHF71_02365 [Vulcanibacillus modesticaldus]|uniref:Non-canonical purine NTP pyrophosphatase n=1 Tax=Vulcanibacillus modesticaldus TaxID=337097 RepID=A0A1D2YTP3_9BACI|nr:non-canonical purine NTP pyrophosphatase [Vulcanibacillus modesticaldus]OEF99049.1 hypothetical protein BHF71_02365 [Vulcanibacillus modesticaldus]